MSAFESGLCTIPGLLAGGDLSSSQYLAVKYNSTAGEVIVVTAVTDDCIGVLQDKPGDGEAALVAYSGITKMVAGTTVDMTQGERIAFNTTGQAVPYTGTGTRKVIGRYIDNGETITAGQTLVSVMLGFDN